MRYVGVTRADVRRDCARHRGGDDDTRDEDGVGSLYDTDDADDGVGDGWTRTGAVSDGETTTTTTEVDFDDIMTGANAKHGSMDAMGGEGMVLCGCDVIAALELTKCVNDGWDGAEEEGARFRARVAARMETTRKIFVPEVAKEGLGLNAAVVRDVFVESPVLLRGMEFMEVPVMVESDGLKARLLSIANATIDDDASFENAFMLDDERLETLHCVENDLSTTFTVERQSRDDGREQQYLENGTLKNFMSLFGLARFCETPCVVDDETPRSPLDMLLGLMEKTKVVWSDALNVASRRTPNVYLKNLLRPARIEYPARDELEQIESARRVAKPRETEVLPKFVEVNAVENGDVDIRKLLKPLTQNSVNDQHEAPRDPDFEDNAKGKMKASLLPASANQMQPLAVPRMDEDGEDSPAARSARAMNNIIRTVTDFKKESKVLPKWNVKFPFLDPFTSDKREFEQPEFFDELVFDELVFDDDEEFEKLPGDETTVRDEKSSALDLPFHPPTLSESFEIPGSLSNRTVTIDRIELSLNSQQMELVRILAERYVQITQMLPMEIQEKVPRFKLGAKTSLMEDMKMFDAMPVVSQSLQSLLCCHAAANLVNIYGIHIAYLYMNNQGKMHSDLCDIVDLFARYDSAVMRGDFEDHPKLDVLKSVVANVAVTGGKLLIIFPDTKAILSIRRFVSKFNMTAAQFDGRQQFRQLAVDGNEDLIRAVTLSASNADVLLVLEDHVAHDAFPMSIFTSCVYYAPSTSVTDQLDSFSTNRHASNVDVCVLCMKSDICWSEDLEPASSEHVNQELVTRQQTSAVVDEPQLSPPVDFGDIPHHIVVFNTARQLVKAREPIFAQVEHALLEEGCDVVLRQSTIDVDALMTIDSHVHGVLLIVPEYFAEGAPTQFEMFSLVEDLTMAMAGSVVSSTLIFEGDEGFLSLANSIENRLVADARRMGFDLDVRYCLDEQVSTELFETLRPRADALSNFTTPLPKNPSMEEINICALFPKLNPISACVLLALDDVDVPAMLRNTGALSADLIEYLHANEILGCPPSVLGGRFIEQQPEISSPRAISYSPQIGSRRTRSLRCTSDEPLAQFLSPPKRQRIGDNWELNALSPIRSPPASRFGRHSYVSDRVEAPSPVMDVSISPPDTPRTFFKREESPIARKSLVPKYDAGRRLWHQPQSPSQAKGSQEHDVRKTLSLGVLGKGNIPAFNSSDFPRMVESFRMPPSRTHQENRFTASVDSRQNLVQHRFKKMKPSNRLPSSWH